MYEESCLQGKERPDKSLKGTDLYKEIRHLDANAQNERKKEISDFFTIQKSISEYVKSFLTRNRREAATLPSATV